MVSDLFIKEGFYNYIVGHLHTGNIIIDNDRVKLLDIENGVLGVPSFYRPYFMQHKKIFSMQSIDIYSFGHTLYEMTFGAPLHESVVENYPTECQHLLSTIIPSTKIDLKLTCLFYRICSRFNIIT